MTNFQVTTGGRRLQREQVLLWTPVLLGGLLAAVSGGLLLWPAWQKLNLAQQQLGDLQEQQSRIPLLRQQLLKQQENLAKAQQRQQTILQLIAGSGNISTFMSQLGQEARRSGVLLDSYEPLTTTAAPAAAPAAPPAAGAPPAPAPAAPPAAAAPAAPHQPPPPPADPLLVDGLQKTTLLISARGSGPQLLDFLRRLERLGLLVVQSDLTLKHEAAPAATNGKPAPPGLTTIKLNLALYAKAAAAPAEPAKP